MFRFSILDLIVASFVTTNYLYLFFNISIPYPFNLLLEFNTPLTIFLIFRIFIFIIFNYFIKGEENGS